MLHFLQNRCQWEEMLKGLRLQMPRPVMRVASWLGKARKGIAPGTEGQHYPIRGLVLSMARSFYHDTPATEIKDFCRNEFGIEEFHDYKDGDFTILRRIDVTAIADPAKGMVPGIFLSGVFTEQEKQVFLALKRKFGKSRQEVVLKYLGPDYV